MIALKICNLFTSIIAQILILDQTKTSFIKLKKYVHSIFVVCVCLDKLLYSNKIAFTELGFLVMPSAYLLLVLRVRYIAEVVSHITQPALHKPLGRSPQTVSARKSFASPNQMTRSYFIDHSSPTSTCPCKEIYSIKFSFSF